MSLNLEQELDPSSPEYEAAMEARQDLEDAEREAAQAKPADQNTEQEQTTPEAQTSAVVEVKEPVAEVVSAEAPAIVKVAGVASKDGSRVLPYAALQAERRSASRERGARERAEAELAQARQTIEDLKSGKVPAEKSADDLSDADIEQIATDFPALAKVARAVKSTREQLAVAQAKPAAAEKTTADDDTDPAAEALQDAIDMVPLLSEWQAADPEKFARAVEIDGVARNSPKWRDKPMVDRFAYVAKQVADEFDIQIPDPSPRSTTKPADKASDVIASAKRAAPNTLSDFKGGQVEQTTERIENMSVIKARDRMASMTDAEIDAHLAKFG